MALARAMVGLPGNSRGLFPASFLSRFMPALRLLTDRGLALRGLLSRTAVILTLVFVVVGCQNAPHTGRKQFISPFITVQEEIDLGTEAYRQALAASEVSANTTYNRRVERVGNRLAEASGRSDLDWEFTVIEDDDTINAWALPGGKIAVYTGLLKLTEDDDALLATVMGHEIAHVTQRHGAERLTQQQGINLVGAGLLAALQDREPEKVNLVLSAFGVGTNLLVVLPFSRDMEAESDRVGLKFMAMAGYDPEASIEFWKRMGAATGGGNTQPKFLSTHPPHGERLENLRKWIPEARQFYRPIQP